MIKAIIFDMDDTLVVEVASADKALKDTCQLAKEKYALDIDALHQTILATAKELWFNYSPARPYCVSIGISSWEGLWGSLEGEDPNLKILKKWAPTYRKQAWSNALKEYGIQDEPFAEFLAITFPTQRRLYHIVYPDVEPTLENLKPNFKLAMLTNGAPGIQREKLDGSKLEPFFKEIIISGETGIAKPKPEAFQITLNRLDATPEQTIMIGNSLESDIAGAQQAGIKAIWLNRDKKENGNPVKPDYEIKNLSKLQAVLHDLE